MAGEDGMAMACRVDGQCHACRWPEEGMWIACRWAANGMWKVYGRYVVACERHVEGSG